MGMQFFFLFRPPFQESNCGVEQGLGVLGFANVTTVVQNFEVVRGFFGNSLSQVASTSDFRRV